MYSISRTEKYELILQDSSNKVKIITLCLVMYLGLLAFSTTISLSMFFSLFRIVLSLPVMNAFFPAAVPASYNIPILSSKLALRGKLFSLEQASNVEVVIVSEVYPRLRRCLFKQKPFCY